MSADSNKRKRNTQIPPEAIECSAGIYDKTEMTGYVVAIDCARAVENPNKNNTKTVTGDSRARDVVSSTELREGISIVAKDGGRPVVEKETKKDGPEI